VVGKVAVLASHCSLEARNLQGSSQTLWSERPKGCCSTESPGRDRDLVTRILFIANHFPPIGGGGVQRAAKFARYLPEFGVEPVILTGPEQIDGHWTPVDATLWDEVKDLEVFRVPGPAPPDTRSNVQRRLERLSGVTPRFNRWWVEVVERFAPTAGANVDVILAELVPYETAFAARRVAEKLGLPWIADLQDPWALDEMWLYPSAVHRLADRARMRKTLGRAAAVVMNTPEAAKRLIEAFPEIEPRRVSSIPNGFDPSDFDVQPVDWSHGIFRIVHSGYLHTESGLQHRARRGTRHALGGMPIPGIDILTRSHVFLMQAVEQVLRDDPTLAGTIEVHLVGATRPDDYAAAASYDFVRFHGYRTHGETIAMLQGADLLFLPMQDLPPGRRAGLVPGKTYEYMATGTPILAAIPPGDARDILAKLGNATLCEPSSVRCMAEAIRARVNAWRDGRPAPAPDPTVLRTFERRGQAAELAAILKGVDKETRSASHPRRSDDEASPRSRYTPAEATWSDRHRRTG
jgi:glycosyltransferase involved in cell wall biosynthesis